MDLLWHAWKDTVLGVKKFLFDLCLAAGLSETAWALAESGIEGCALEVHHLKRKFHDQNSGGCGTCKDGRQTCDECCFGFPVDQGIWMKDWNANLADAAEAARQTAEQPFVRAALKTFRSGPVPHTLAISEEAVTHLLDIAILIGDKEAAVCCAKHSALRPLRRWSSDGIFEQVVQRRSLQVTEEWTIYFNCWSLRIKDPEGLLTAMSIGTALETLSLMECASKGYEPKDDPWQVCDQPLPTWNCLPFREAVALSGSPWAEFADLLPPKTPWKPRIRNGPRNGLGGIFLQASAFALCADRLQHAQMAGIEFQHFGLCYSLEKSFREASVLSLLDLAILSGQSDCAALCASTSMTLFDPGCHILRRCLTADPKRFSAAVAAAQVTWDIAWRNASLARLNANLLLRRFSQGVEFPTFLVWEVAAILVNPPLIIDDLDLWEEWRRWYRSGWCRKDLFPSPKCEMKEVQMEIDGLQGGESSSKPVDPVPGADEATDEKAGEQDALMRAIQETRSEMPPLNVDGVRLFRLTRMANANHVVDLLFDPTGPLKELHDRVQEAGCSTSADNTAKQLFPSFPF